MKPAEKIKRLFIKSNVSVSSQLDEGIIGDTLRAFEKSKKTTSAPTQPNIWRIIMRSKITKIATAAVIIMAMIIGIHHLGGSVDMASVAFGDVLERIYTAKTVTYKETIQIGDREPSTTKEMVVESGLKRSDMSNGNVLIFDFNSGTHLQLLPQSEKAVITHYVGRPRGKQLFNYLEWISELHERQRCLA